MRAEECRHPANGLLPWYVKGTLQGTELEWVQDHVGSCAICARECEELAQSPEEIVGHVPLPARRKHRPLPYALAAALVVPAAVGLYCMWVAWQGGGLAGRTGQLAPTVYLDLGVGPTRATEPLESLALSEDVGSVVISFFVPLSDRALYTFDLEGPRANVLVRGEPIRGIDPMGRCTYVFPSALFHVAGDYAIVVRVVAPDGESRLYPYPFQVGSAGAPAHR